MIYEVLIEETLSRTVVVEAETPMDAQILVQEQLDNEQIVLDENDYDGCRIIDVFESCKHDL